MGNSLFIYFHYDITTIMIYLEVRKLNNVLLNLYNFKKTHNKRPQKPTINYHKSSQ